MTITVGPVYALMMNNDLRMLKIYYIVGWERGQGWRGVLRNK